MNRLDFWIPIIITSTFSIIQIVFPGTGAWIRRKIRKVRGTKIRDNAKSKTAITTTHFPWFSLSLHMIGSACAIDLLVSLSQRTTAATVGEIMELLVLLGALCMNVIAGFVAVVSWMWRREEKKVP